MRISHRTIKLGALATGGTFALALALAPQQASAQGATCGTYAAGAIIQPAQGTATAVADPLYSLIATSPVTSSFAELM